MKFVEKHEVRLILQQWLYDAVLLIYKFIPKLSPKYFCGFTVAKRL